ncbi:MAG: hypothetical protein IE925_10055 [Rhodobacterales bacterium]|nr:hypothetical protein [Rhodobacterales bacterium]
MKLLHLAALAAAAFSLSACAALQALPSVQDKDNTPRQAGAIVQADIAPAVADLADLCEAGILQPDTKAVIAEYGPKIRTLVGAYADSAANCVVIDGRLQTDPSAGQVCARGDVKAVTAELPALLTDAGRAIGLDTPTGYRVFWAGFAARRIVGTNAGGVIDGFSKDPDLTLDEYLAVWAPVQASADRLQACVAAG